MIGDRDGRDVATSQGLPPATEAGRGQEGIFPWSPWREHCPTIPGLQISGLQNYEEIFSIGLRP